AGGACLAVIALVLFDLQNGKKLGISDKAVTAMRQVPGLEKADEGTILGALTLGAAGCLGIPMTIDMAQNGMHAAGLFNNAENYIAFPLGAAFSFQNTRRRLESLLGSEMRFDYTDAQGAAKKTTPIATSRLLQQVAYLCGAAGIFGMGAALDNTGIEFTGVMFGLANGMSIRQLVKEPVGEVLEAKMQKLAAHMQDALDKADKEPAADARAHLAALQKEWKAVAAEFGQGKPVRTQAIKDLGRRAAAAISHLAADYLRPAQPEQTRPQR
ncbi:MAG: hypothetical protein EBX37_17185, partial [Alphaproteobacteria bacterium]|nr:hypothetical protein [Alphaproteobacteria bacterium]